MVPHAAFKASSLESSSQSIPFVKFWLSSHNILASPSKDFTFPKSTPFFKLESISLSISSPLS